MIPKILAGISLLICLATPFLYFWGSIGESAFKSALAVASLAWFVFGTLAARRRRA